MKGLSPLLRNTIGILIVFAVSAVALLFLFNRLTKKSLYEEAGNVSLKGLKEKVTVTSDSYGVPYISAGNDADLYFTLGYLHARDRLWQMDLARRVGQGRISEIFGKDVIEIDKLFRTIGISRQAEKLYQTVSPKSKEILGNYTKGVNEFIRINNKSLPLEFDVLNYKPEPWTPENSLAIVRLMGWELNLSWYTDFMFGEIVSKFGIEKAKDFFPGYPEDAPFIVKQEKSATDKKKEIPDMSDGEKYLKTALLGKDFYNKMNMYRDYFGISGTHVGSNSWVVNGKKTESRKPILASDPHLVLQAPSRWYEAQLFNTSDKSRVSGFSIPGAPGIAIGQNGAISWGITNLMNDDSDFYVLRLDSADNKKYIYGENSFPLDSVIEYIKVKDIKDEVPCIVYFTKTGPVISNLERTGFMSDNKFRTGKSEILTFRWTGYENSDEIKCFWDIYHSNNWNDFKASLKNFGLPASNFTYADTAGNIGYHAAGLVPIRKNFNGDVSAATPSNGDIEWTGFVSADELPQSYNPESGYIVTANNKPEKDYKYYISNLYEPPYRAARIEEVIKNKTNITPNEFKLLQNDVVSLQAKEFCRYIFDAYKDSIKITPEEVKYLTLLKKWDYDMGRLNTAASVYSQFEIELYENLYKLKLGDKLFKEYIFINNIPVRNTSKILKESDSWLLGNSPDSVKGKGRDELIRKSFRDAIESLTKRFGTGDQTKWIWGDIHKVLIRHPLGSIPAFSTILNIGPFDIGGCGTTVANAEYTFAKALDKTEFECYLGASMRFIANMADTKSYYSILPPGQSGQPQHQHYGDQARLWLHGEYKNVIAVNPGNENVQVLILIPD
ncbi:MAG: penicillin acylase family protein [Ignavibacteriae bacterium]|nr:penicillin acylase family protein [Ignavibacteriota bacterium]